VAIRDPAEELLTVVEEDGLLAAGAEAGQQPMIRCHHPHAA
jgi:hypothetical protein